MRFGFVLSILGMGFCGFQGDLKASYTSDQDWEEAYYEDYSTANTLPTLPLYRKGTDEEALQQIGSLTKITRKDAGPLEVLDDKLLSAHQYRPGFNLQKMVRLFEGNKQRSSIRGWTINLRDGDQDVPVGMIAYGYHRSSYYDPRFPKWNTPFAFLEDKVCFEVEWYIRPDYQRRGLARSAVQAVVSYIREVDQRVTKMDYLMAMIAKSNGLSGKFAEALTFKFVGTDQDTNQYAWSLAVNPALQQN